MQPSGINVRAFGAKFEGLLRLLDEAATLPDEEFLGSGSPPSDNASGLILMLPYYLKVF